MFFQPTEEALAAQYQRGRKEALPLVNELIRLTPVDTPGKVGGEE